MQNKLIKAWGPYGVGTVIVDNKAEAEKVPGSVRVNPARFALLTEKGHFRAIPAEVKTSGSGEEETAFRPISDAAPAMNKGGHNDPPKTPRPATSPVGQGEPEKEP